MESSTVGGSLDFIVDVVLLIIHLEFILYDG